MLIRQNNNTGFNYEFLKECHIRGVVLRIGLIDADLLDGGTRHPNLAILKISGFCKDILGHNVRLIEDYKELGYEGDIQKFIKNCPYDVLSISQVFKFSKHPEFIDELITEGYIFWGGTGFKEIDGPVLPDEIEHHMPDYSLYLDYIKNVTGGDSKIMKRDWDDYLSYSIGFTTRGCIRHCPFCVNRESNGVQKWADVSEFLDPKRSRIYLWDDNILAAPSKVLEDVMKQLGATGKSFQFRQGMDIRLLTDAKAKMLENCHYYGDFIFAFDHYRRDDMNELKNVEQTIRGLQIWRKYSSKQTKLYVLVAFDGLGAEDIEGTFWRIKVLMHYGCLPYIMRFENYSKSQYMGMYIQLARWCNQPNMFKKMTFREFCLRNEEYYQQVPKPDKHCSSYRAMTEFEHDYPEIASKYFDMRYDVNRRLKFLGKDIEKVNLDYFD